MRPVNRGSRPCDANGVPKEYRTYQRARRDLMERIGRYCSYCERPVSVGIAVEHIRPKIHSPEFELEWENFLLSCTNCNSAKGDRDVTVSDYYWPHLDNTFRAISYGVEGIVSCAEGLTTEQSERAQRTIDLFGLDRDPDRGPEASDLRWQDRREVFDLAHRAKAHISERPDDPMIQEWVIQTAISRGNWSIWMNVFSEHSTILRRLIMEFAGTSTDCFDDLGRPVPRPDGAV